MCSAMANDDVAAGEGAVRAIPDRAEPRKPDTREVAARLRLPYG